MPAVQSALQSPQVSAKISPKRKAMIDTIIPAMPVPPDSPSAFARDIAMPPSTAPTSATTGAPNDSTLPTPGSHVSRMPPNIISRDTTPSTIEPTPMGARVASTRGTSSPVARRVEPLRAAEPALAC